MTTNGQEAPTSGAGTAAGPSLQRDLRFALGWGARLAVVGLMAWIGLSINHPLGPLVDLAIGIVLGLALLGLGSLGLSLLGWITQGWVRVLGSGVLVASIGALTMLSAFSGLPPLLALTIWGMWLLGAACACLAVVLIWRPLRTAPGATPGLGSGRLRFVLAVVSGLVAVAVVAWLWWPGSDEPIEPFAAGGASPLELPDPGEPGALVVASLRYGSGVPGWRPEYGDDAALRTTSVDVSDLVELGPIAHPARRAALGFDLDEVPRNALVWYPDQGEGPFPLVLVAHGNANLYEPSEDGYAWLGQHLASHGFVVASIDASAFNSLPVIGSLRGENHARALLMLAHLQLWQAWEGDAEAALPRVDLTRVALLGHSRGGEAAAIAATLDRIGRLPSDAISPLFERVGGPHGVRAVIAIAPSDGQYRPGDRPTALAGVDYLVIHGGFDADVSSFVGERQYERALPGEGGFKSAVYIHHANHGQFNDVWGRYDQPRPLAPLLRTAAIMPKEDQQRAGAALITAFLRASLLGERDYREFLRDPRRGAAWLPPTAYVTRYDDGGLTLLGDVHAVEPNTGSLPGSTVSTSGLALWRVGDPGFRAEVRRDAVAVTIGWSASASESDPPDEPRTSPPEYRLHLPVPLSELLEDPAETLISLKVARGTQGLPDGPAPTGELDASLALSDDTGEVASLALSDAGGVPPHLPTIVTRLAPFEALRYRPDAYPLFQRLDLPVSDFLEANPELDLGLVHELALVFDRVPEGVLTLRSIRLVSR